VSAWPFLIGRGWGMIELKTKSQEKTKTHTRLVLAYG